MNIADAIAAATPVPWPDQLPVHADRQGYLRACADQTCADAQTITVADCGCAVWRMQPWDSELLNVAVARVEFFSGTEPVAVACALRQSLEHAGARYVTVRVAAGDLRSHWALQRVGFDLVDGLLTFGLRLTAARSAVKHAAGFSLRLATAADADPLAALGAPLFQAGRLHADPRIPPASAERVYAEWIRNACLGTQADAVWVAEDEQGMVGYLAGKIDPLTRDYLRFPILTFVLAGVIPRARRLGVAAWLTDAALAWATAQGIAAVRIGTQIDNIASARLFESAGFRIQSSSLTLRSWIDP